ncbi:MAG: signal peptidase I [Chloroflexi bacterium]|nr:signal peptidase I [Chloroflexota bacterium]
MNDTAATPGVSQAPERPDDSAEAGNEAAQESDIAGSAVYVEAWDSHDSRTSPKTKRRRGLLFARDAVQTGIIVLLIFLGTQSAVESREIEGPSMEPTYQGGQQVLVNRALYTRLNINKLLGWVPFVDAGGARYLFHRPDRGEVIVFAPPFKSRDDLIKRVIGVPGDHVVVSGETVSVNGQRVDEPYLRGVDTACGGRWCDITLGEDEYYVMGDNRTNSSDSRLWGPVKADKIVGKAWFIFRPFGDFGVAP